MRNRNEGRPGHQPAGGQMHGTPSASARSSAVMHAVWAMAAGLVSVLPVDAQLVTPSTGMADSDRSTQAATRSIWNSGVTCYEVFVRSFQDSDGDGIGDLTGLIQRLDYINDGDPSSRDDLGAGCVWLMPISPTVSYHGYDIIDFYGVDPRYGSLDDFRRLMDEAHKRGIRVIVDLVINHSSDQHPFFKDATLHPDSPYREFYRWSDRPGPDNEYGDNNWRRSPFDQTWYYGFFSSVMPDLNWESPALRAEMERVADFWLLEVGVDGFRLDAVRHLMESADGVSTNAPRTHDMLREYGAHIRSVAPAAFTIGEVFDSTSALRPYYPDQLDGYFAFQVSNGILAAVRDGSASALLSAVTEIDGAIPDHRWAPFLRNHDQSRTATWLEGDTERAGLAATLLLTIPGLPVVYYGEELGMTGDKPDPRIRTPMHWTRERAAGFTTGVPWEPLQPDSFTANVQVMDGDAGSLLNHYRRLIHIRAEDPALASGDFLPLETGTDAVVAWVRRSDPHATIVIANLSKEGSVTPTVSSDPGALPTGNYGAQDLLEGGPVGSLRVGTDGSIRGWRPVAALGPLEAVVLRLGRE